MSQNEYNICCLVGFGEAVCLILSAAFSTKCPGNAQISDEKVIFTEAVFPAASSFSTEQAAETCGVTPEYIHKLMHNPDKIPGVSTLYKLADLVDVTPDYLGGFVDDPQGRSPHTPKPKELTEFLENEHVMFHGVQLNDEDKQKIENVLIGLFWEAKQMNKRNKRDK
jgi:transcriptional regulator with XRE-family HTH domain